MTHFSVHEIITDRAIKRIPFAWLHKMGINECYFGGGGLCRDEPNDIDLFPVIENQFSSVNQQEGLISVTRNAKTYKTESGCVIQLCNFFHPSLIELVESFDFAHIKAGVHVNVENKTVSDVYISSDWLHARELETSWYTGSAYPLSSLIRICKYIKRGTFPGRSYIRSIISILNDLVLRGYENYEDFKDQLDAVDLALVEEELHDADIITLFNLLKKEPK